MRAKHFRLLTLGRLKLLAPDGAPADAVLDALNARRRKVALLAVLALARRPISRDSLLEMFWGEQDEGRARHSLSDAASHLRRVLGPHALVATRAELSLSPEAPLTVDALELAAATDRARIIELYDGPFLEGVHVPASPSFDQWAARERARLERLFTQACSAECEALARSQRWGECANVAERWLDAAPLSAEAGARLLGALPLADPVEGDSRALAAYEGLRLRLAREYDLTPDARLGALASEAAARLAERGVQAVLPAAGPAPTPETSAAATAPAPSPAPVAAPPAMAASRPSRSRRRTLLVAIGATVAASLLLFAAAIVLAVRRGDAWADAATPTRPVIAVASIEVTARDTSIEWLAEGLPQMITARLSRTSEIDVVPPAQVRAVRARAQWSGSVTSPERIRELGHRVGATAVVVGSLTRRGDVVSIEIGMHDVATGGVIRLDALSDTSVVALVDRVAVRLLDAAGFAGTGPRLAELETPSLEAYHHFARANQLAYERPVEAMAELDAAVALDSGFTSALLGRLSQAFADNDEPTIRSLDAALRRRGSRIPERDRLEWESRLALTAGDVARSESLGRMLVERWPRDPRGYATLASVYGNAGRWDALEQLVQQLLAVDSLGMEAGRGPCSACFAFGTLTDARTFRGDLPGAERAARRWVALAPGIHAAWVNLALVLTYRGRYDEAEQALDRAAALAPGEPFMQLARGWVFVMSRRLDAADSAIARWGASDSRALRIQAADLRSVVERERGRFRAANATLARAIAEFPEMATLGLVRADGLARIGECAEAIRAFEGMHSPSPAAPRAGQDSRAFAWHHALMADAVMGAPPAAAARCASAVALPALADSVERFGARSYYGRDWSLHHHLRALLAERAGDWRRAESEYRRARWRVADGWSRTVLGLGRVQLAQGRPAEAIATFREAYLVRPDAMGRYLPRSEIDFAMARAFAAAGMRDSAAVYARHVRAAWSDADPEVKARLAELP